MKKSTVDKIRKLAEDGFGEIYEDYSGRNMYGATCIGISTDNPDALIEEAASRGIKGAKKDNLGKNYIVYWPN
jgi:hypothetical protein